MLKFDVLDLLAEGIGTLGVKLDIRSISVDNWLARAFGFERVVVGVATFVGGSHWFSTVKLIRRTLSNWLLEPLYVSTEIALVGSVNVV